jgi:hypothetical protein
VAVPLLGTVQAVQATPQVATAVLLTHMLLHSWNPELQTKAQPDAPQVAVAFVGAVQIVLQLPQWFTSVEKS